MEFVTAARAMGASKTRIMFRHILRNALAPVLVPITFGIAGAILIESGAQLSRIWCFTTQSQLGYLAA